MDRCPAALFTNLQKDIVDIFPHLCGPCLPAIQLAVSSQEAAAVSILQSALKKLTPVNGTPELKARAISKMLECNEVCSTWTPTKHPLFGLVLDEMALRAHRELPSINWGKIFQRGRCGPGSSVGSRGANSAFEKLFLNRMSTTSMALYGVHSRLLASFPWLKAAEKQRLALRGASSVRVVEGSTTSTVRKDLGIDRVIGTEASLNMFYQLGLGELLNEHLLTEYGYSSALQPDRNRVLACQGSKSGRIATVDLVSASDLIAYQLCNHVFRSDWMAAFDDLRSAVTKVDGAFVPLHMMSTMGNGFTFPLQTYVFSLAIRSLCKVLGVEWTRYDDPATRFGVFGDDIIVPVEIYETLLSLLQELGCKPNATKSFADGPFRESCGSDWWCGVNIRGVYIRRLDTDASLFSAVNRLNMWSARHLIPLRRTIRYLLPKGWTRFIIPTDEDMSGGVMVPHRKMRSNYQYTCLTPISERVRVFRHDGTLKSRFANPFGLLYAIIEGSVRSGCISRRQRETNYEETMRTVPYWVRHVDLFAHGVAYSNWEVLTTMNLTGS